MINCPFCKSKLKIDKEFIEGDDLIFCYQQDHQYEYTLNDQNIKDYEWYNTNLRKNLRCQVCINQWKDNDTIFWYNDNLALTIRTSVVEELIGLKLELFNLNELEVKNILLKLEKLYDNRVFL